MIAILMIFSLIVAHTMGAPPTSSANSDGDETIEIKLRRDDAGGKSVRSIFMKKSTAEYIQNEMWLDEEHKKSEFTLEILSKHFNDILQDEIRKFQMEMKKKPAKGWWLFGKGKDNVEKEKFDESDILSDVEKNAITAFEIFINWVENNKCKGYKHEDSDGNPILYNNWTEEEKSFIPGDTNVFHHLTKTAVSFGIPGLSSILSDHAKKNEYSGYERRYDS